MFDFRNPFHQRKRDKYLEDGGLSHRDRSSELNDEAEKEVALEAARRRNRRRIRGQMNSHCIAPSIEYRGDTAKCRQSQKYAEQCLNKLINYTGGANLNGLQRQTWLDDGGYIHTSTAAGIHKIKIYRRPTEEAVEEGIKPRPLRPVMASFNMQQSMVFFQDPNGKYNFYIDLYDNNAFAPYDSWGGGYDPSMIDPPGGIAYSGWYRSSLHTYGFAVREIPATEGMIFYYDKWADLYMVLKFQVKDLDVDPTDTTEYIDYDLFGDIHNEWWYGGGWPHSGGPGGYGYYGRFMYKPGGPYGLGVQRFYKKPFNFWREQIYAPYLYSCTEGNLTVCGDTNGEPLANIGDLKWSWVGAAYDGETGFVFWCDAWYTVWCDYQHKNANIIEWFLPLWWNGGNIRNVPSFSQSLNADFTDIEHGTMWYIKYDERNDLFVHWPSGDTMPSPWGVHDRQSAPYILFGCPAGGEPDRYSISAWKAWASGGSYYRDFTKDYWYAGQYYHGQLAYPPSPDADYLFSPSQRELIGAHRSGSPYHLPIDFVPTCDVTSIHVDTHWLFWPPGVWRDYPGGWISYKLTGHSWSDVTESEQLLIGYNSKRRNRWEFALYRTSTGFIDAADMPHGMSQYTSCFGYIFGDVSYLEDENT